MMLRCKVREREFTYCPEGNAIRFPEFYRWEELKNWAIHGQTEYEIDYREFGDAGLLEEHLNWVNAAHHGWPENGIDGMVDLMLPVKKRQ